MQINRILGLCLLLFPFIDAKKKNLRLLEGGGGKGKDGKKGKKDKDGKKGKKDDNSYGDHQKLGSDDEYTSEDSNGRSSRSFAAYDENDLGMRFSKITFPDNELPEGARLTLGVEDYPLTTDISSWLRYSHCPSIVVEEDCPECDVSFADLVASVGGYPTHPSSDSASPFWAELQEVTTVQRLRLEDVDPEEIMPLPELWKGFDVEAVAEAVHDEYPGIHHVNLIASLMSQGVQVDQEIVPINCLVEFLRGIVMLSDLNTWSIATVGPHNFGIKYHVGRARPEEVAYSIYEGSLTTEDGVPEQLVDDIMSLDLTSATSYTAYPEGSPKHPAWPAMHSAASSASLWMAVVLNMTEAQLCEVRKTDYAVAYARTVAGVHYPTDNTAGLNLGQEIVAMKLPDHLHERYGSDVLKVKSKIEEMRYDWNHFMDSDCALMSNERLRQRRRRRQRQ